LEKNVSSVENTSGQGRLATIPEEVRGWNWGAFFLNWIWGIGNSVWIALLALLPFGNIIMPIVLGVKGNEWAWRNRKWDSVAHFNRVQRIWAILGVVLVVFPFILALAAVVIPNVGRFVGRGEIESVETECANVQTAVVSMMVDNDLMELPNPVTIATDDMGAFPDTSICGVDKIQDRDGYIYVRGQDKDGYCLYMHDITADGENSPTVNYVATRFSKGTYIIDTYGEVTQVTTGY
jgi:hypothetical protein